MQSAPPMGGVNLESEAEIDAAQNRPEGGEAPLYDEPRCQRQQK
jgi:hypothetical protein